MAVHEFSAPTLQACKSFEAYLGWVEKNRSPATYYAATRYLTSFVQFIGKRKQLRHINADHIETWLEENTTWGSTTQSDAVSILSRAFAWGRRKKHIKHSPVDDLETKPKRKRREDAYRARLAQTIRLQLPPRVTERRPQTQRSLLVQASSDPPTSRNVHGSLGQTVRRARNDQRNRAARLRVDFSLRRIRRSGSRTC